MSAHWLERSMIVTVGTGGVGKTTVAAAIGLEAAARGRRALVLTIDPARRLAQALGVQSLGHEPQRVPAERIAGFECAGAGAASGELYAMMLDTKRTFDEIVERFAPNPQVRQRILANPIYRQLTDALSGSREYSALEKVSQIHASGEYDFIVLDTPPAVHALDFLDAPRRLMGFLDGSFLELLMRPAATLSRTGFSLWRRGSEFALRGLEKLTGMGFLRDLTEFFVAFEGLLGGFRERAAKVAELLRDPACGFVLVAGPDSEQGRRTVEFCGRLRHENVHLAGLVVNRVHEWPGKTLPDSSRESQEAARRWLEPHLGAELAARCIELARHQLALAARDAEAAEQLEKSIPLDRGEAHRVPLLAEDIHTARGLAELRSYLFQG